jgi:hypothetical protein
MLTLEKILTEKLIVTQKVKKLSVLLPTRNLSCHMSMPLVLILSQKNTVQNPVSCTAKNYFNIILWASLRYSKRFPSLRFPSNILAPVLCKNSTNKKQKDLLEEASDLLQL